MRIRCGDGLALLMAVTTGACASSARVTDVELKLAHRAKALEARVSILEATLGRASVVSVKLDCDGQSRVLFGNHSGHHAAVTITNRRQVGTVAPAPGSATIGVQRAPRPVAGAPVDVPVAATPLPQVYETTAPLELGVPGAQRELVVPCGFEVVGSCTGGALNLDAFVRYEEGPCSP